MLWVGNPRPSWGCGLPEAAWQNQVLKQELPTPNLVYLRGKEKKQVELGIAQLSIPVEHALQKFPEN